jgi:hypothetical protein
LYDSRSEEYAGKFMRRVWNGPSSGDNGWWRGRGTFWRRRIQADLGWLPRQQMEATTWSFLLAELIPSSGEEMLGRG